MKSPTHNQSNLENVIGALPLDTLTALRNSAASSFALSGFPTQKDEDWRYTNLAPAIALSNDWLAGGPRSVPEPSEQDTPILQSIDAHWIKIRNGIIDRDWNELPDGVTASLLSSDASDCKASEIAIDDALAQWNAALLTDVLLISVAAGKKIDRPIGFLIDDHASDDSVVTQVRIVVDVDDGASVKLIEAHTSSGSGGHYANSNVQLDLSSQSTVDYVRIQQRARNHIQTGKLAVKIADQAELRHCAFDLGGALIRNDIAAALQGQDATLTMNGLYLAGDKQHIDNHTRADHCVGPSKSTEDYRGILNRHSRAVFNGKVIVHQGADGTDASQSNHNLLLSDDAEIDTKPELEIYADDVKCSHGTTVGQLDDEALFYLRSRGLDANTAQRVLTRAFASGVLSILSVDEATEYLAAAVDERLDTLIGDSGDE